MKLLRGIVPFPYQLRVKVFPVVEYGSMEINTWWRHKAPHTLLTLVLENNELCALYCKLNGLQPRYIFERVVFQARMELCLHLELGHSPCLLCSLTLYAHHDSIRIAISMTEFLHNISNMPDRFWWGNQEERKSWKPQA